MTPYQQGKHRENEIRTWLEKNGSAEAWMLGLQFNFGTMERCRNVLRRMSNRGMINREGGHPIVFYAGTLRQDWRHSLMVNRVRFELQRQAKWWQKILSWEREVKYGTGVADAFFVAETSIGKRRKAFLEIDRTTKFTKTGLYVATFKTQKWVAEPWADPAKTGNVSYPSVLVVTTRPGAVISNVEKENTAGLRIKVVTMDNIVADAWGCL